MYIKSLKYSSVIFKDSFYGNITITHLIYTSEIFNRHPVYSSPYINFQTLWIKRYRMHHKVTVQNKLSIKRYNDLRPENED